MLLFLLSFSVFCSLASTFPSGPADPERQLAFQLSPSALPPLPSFPRHTLLTLNDGTSVPSPAFGVGTAWFGNNGNDTRDAVLSALRVGFRHLDNAAVYGNEAAVGEAIRLWEGSREELYITTKYDALGGESVAEEVEKSLKKLGTSYIDLYLIHFPQFASPETWPAMEVLLATSKVRSIGISNYTPTNLSSLLEVPSTTTVPAVNQIRFHPYNILANAEILQLAAEKGIRLAAYSSLTSLTKDRGGLVDAVVLKIAKSRGWSEGMVLLNWVKGKGILSVTTSGNAQRQAEFLKVFSEDFPSLTKEEVTAIEEAGKEEERKRE